MNKEYNNSENTFKLFDLTKKMRNLSEYELKEYNKSLNNLYKPIGINIFKL